MSHMRNISGEVMKAFALSDEPRFSPGAKRSPLSLCLQSSEEKHAELRDLAVWHLYLDMYVR